MQPDTEKKTGKISPHTEEEPLKGTFASVLMLGAFIVVCWFAVFSLFLNRA
ncbi:cytochrome c oxidase subunit 2A [Brevibacillus sp. SYP-B805]|uniref:cytochrome c oxidase subunit 2A n=1 Tax=Brevibacillus sp. SYP-B805 TaxID=1578199 RepID=UPI0013EB74BE|nr:cytochrome c oxidase subunit 2A [Brevibacillus sp. SYP-B805]NGQ94194.1 cytochrome c oxidase subunit 2A [Brevibacillus sp. SYP-B805]